MELATSIGWDFEKESHAKYIPEMIVQFCRRTHDITSYEIKPE